MRIMNVEEKVNKEILFVLRKIRDRELKTKKGAVIEYYTSNVLLAGEGYPLPSDEGKILEKLEEMGVLKIHNPGGTSDYV